MLHDRNQPLPKGTMLIYPVLDKRMCTTSMKHFTDTPIWDSNCDRLFWDMYLKGVENSQTKYVSISEIENLRFFPPTYIEAAEYNCLHDEEIEFVEKLKSQGVPVEIHDMKGTCHGYETAIKSSIVEKCISWRVEWIRGYCKKSMKIKTPRLTITTFSLDMAQAVYENSRTTTPDVLCRMKFIILLKKPEKQLHF